MGNSVRVHSQQRGGGQNPQNEDVCTDCSISFKLFCRRKHFCSTCMSPYCTNCILDESNQSQHQRYKCCRRCRVFTKTGLIREDLMGLKVRDLLWFLKERNVQLQANIPKEKEELAQWILEFINIGDNGQVTREAGAHMDEEIEELAAMERVTPTRHRVEDIENQTSRTTVHPGPTVRTIITNGDVSADNEGFQSEEELSRFRSINNRDNLTPINTVNSPVTIDGQVTDNLPNDPAPVISGEMESEGTSIESNMPVSSDSFDQESAPKFSSTQRVTLAELPSEATLDQLTVRQLKDLLASNFVDYKGCCEKQELRSRASRLWLSNRENNKRLAGQAGDEFTASEGGSGEGVDSSSKILAAAATMVTTEECKVCMDAPVDCVFLECGHMVTCVTCGKQMNECPICRQYIVRAVRIFRS